MTLNIVVEGQTEERFVKEVLYHHLLSFNIYAYPLLISAGEKKGRKYKGGVISYKQVKNDISKRIRQFKNHPDVYFSTMIDLFGLDKLHEKFPFYDEARSRIDKYEQVLFLEDKFREDVNHPFGLFIPYIQLHEFEALLFSQTEKFKSQFRDCDKITRLKEVSENFTNPEMIDDENPPSYRIKVIFPYYEKVRHGVIIAKEIGLKIIRDKCPHFNEWINKLEQLGQ